MFGTVHLHLHVTNQKLEGNVWEICSKSLHLRKLTCSVFLHFKFGEMLGTMQLHLHDTNQKL